MFIKTYAFLSVGHIANFWTKSQCTHRLTICMATMAVLVDYLKPYLDVTSRILCLTIQILFKIFPNKEQEREAVKLPATP